MDAPSVPREPAVSPRALHLAPFAAICAVMAYVWIITSGLYNSPLGRIPLVAVGVLAGVLSILDLRIGLGLLIFAIGVSPEFQIQGVSNLRLEDFLFPVILLSWLIRFTVRNERFTRTDLKVPILLTVFISVVSSILNSAYSQADISLCLFRLAKSAEYFLIFTITLNTVRRQEDLRRFIYLMLAVGALVGLYGMFQTFHAHSRVTGPSGETANILGGYFVFHICLALGLLSSSRRHRPWLLLGLAMMVLPLLNTFARTSYVALFGGIVAMFVLRRSIWIGVLALVCLVSVTLSADVSERVITILNIFQGEIPSSLESRVEGWKLMLGYLTEAPILGHGVGTLALGAFDNESVRQMFELGFVGLLLFFWMLWRILKTSLSLCRIPGEPAFQGFAYGCFGATVALLVHSLGATTFTTIRTAESFFFALGILYAIASRTAPAREIEEEIYEDLPSELPMTNLTVNG